MANPNKPNQDRNKGQQGEHKKGQQGNRGEQGMGHRDPDRTNSGRDDEEMPGREGNIGKERNRGDSERNMSRESGGRTSQPDRLKDSSRLPE
ncbi:MAG TPA: hypothetical protein VJ813_21015 [Vicinamibacterales bacterium]|nr:hypothetical protein [Vicinamibacterales bacterium]